MILMMMMKATQLYTNLYIILYTLAIFPGNPLHALLYTEKNKSQCFNGANLIKKNEPKFS
jgi:hypothetical protein